MTKKKIALIAVGVFCVICVICVFIPDGKTATKPQAAAKTETAAAAPAKIQFFKNAPVEKSKNPLAFNFENGSTIAVVGGRAQVVNLSDYDWKSVNGKNLADFFDSCNFAEFKFVWFLNGAGQGLQITNDGKNAWLGFVDDGNKNDVRRQKPAREFFYYADEKRIQYFNASDSDDEPLRDLLESDKPLLW